MLPLHKMTKLNTIDSAWLNSLAPEGSHIGALYKLMQTNDGEFWLQEMQDPEAPADWPVPGLRVLQLLPGERFYIHCFNETQRPPFNIVRTDTEPPFKGTGYITVGLADLLVHLIPEQPYVDPS